MYFFIIFRILNFEKRLWVINNFNKKLGQTTIKNAILIFYSLSSHEKVRKSKIFNFRKLRKNYSVSEMH